MKHLVVVEPKEDGLFSVFSGPAGLLRLHQPHA